jgi:hypothetical protein
MTQDQGKHINNGADRVHAAGAVEVAQDSVRRYSTFISHRHDDYQLADIVRKHLVDWGVEHQDIFQSSYSESGARIGESLSQQLREKLHEAKVVVLLYTFGDANWAYCMWESGVAINPRKLDTRIVVLQCTPDILGPFGSDVVVRVNETETQRFAHQVHCMDGFWPGLPALRPMIPEAALSDRAARFYSELRDAVPKRRAEQIRRWDSFTLRLSRVAAESAAQLAEDDEQELCLFFRNNCVIVDAFGEAMRHFGYQDFQEGLTLDHLATRWSQGTRKLDQASEEWLGLLCRQLWRAANNMASENIWKLMRSAREGTNWWLHLPVNLVTINSDNSMDFHIAIYRVPENFPKEGVSL